MQLDSLPQHLWEDGFLLFLPCLQNFGVWLRVDERERHLHDVETSHEEWWRRRHFLLHLPNARSVQVFCILWISLLFFSCVLACALRHLDLAQMVEGDLLQKRCLCGHPYDGQM